MFARPYALKSHRAWRVRHARLLPSFKIGETTVSECRNCKGSSGCMDAESSGRNGDQHRLGPHRSSRRRQAQSLHPTAQAVRPHGVYPSRQPFLLMLRHCWPPRVDHRPDPSRQSRSCRILLHVTSSSLADLAMLGRPLRYTLPRPGGGFRAATSCLAVMGCWRNSWPSGF